MTDPVLTVFISAFAGLISGVVGSLIAPWVHWGVEKRRGRLASRRETIAAWRLALAPESFDWPSFRESSAYAMLRPHLSEHLEKQMQGEVLRIQNGGRGTGVNNWRPQLLDLVSEIERVKWKLV